MIPPGSYLVYCFNIKPFITLQSICQNIIMFCECRRIKDYQIILIFYVLQKSKRIFPE